MNTPTHEITILERQEVLELIYRLLLENRATEAMELSQLIANTPDKLFPLDSCSSPLELELHSLIKGREYERAAERFDSRTKDETLSAEGEHLAGIAYGWTGRYDEARRYLLRARARGSRRAILNLAALEFRSQHFDASARLLERAIETGGFSEDELVEFEDQLGDAYQALGKGDRARENFARVIERLEGADENDPRLAWALRRLSALEFSQARFAQSLRLAERGLRVSHEAAVLIPLMAYQIMSLAMLGRDEEARTAINVFKGATTSDPNAWISLHLAKALLEWLGGNRQAALVHDLEAAYLCERHGLQRQALMVAWQLVPLHQQLGDLEGMRHWRAMLQTLLEPSVTGSRFERMVALADSFVQLIDGQFDVAQSGLEQLATDFALHHQPSEAMTARLLLAEAHLALGQIERGRRALLSVLDWWELHGRTPLVALTLGSTPRVTSFARASDDPKLETLYRHFAVRYGVPLETIYLTTLTSHPELRFEDRLVPLGNRHVVPLLAYLHVRGSRGATVADIGRDLYPELRGEPLRNRVKSARNELRAAIATAIQAELNALTSLSDLTIVSEGTTRSTVLRLETGHHMVRWDLEELEQALTSNTSDWVWLLSTYHGNFLEGYDLENDEGWIQTTRERLHGKLLERAASLVAEWFTDGRFEQLRSLMATLLERGILDPSSALTDVICAFEVRAVATLNGKEAALAVWSRHLARFQAAFVDAPELEAVHPNQSAKTGIASQTK